MKYKSYLRNFVLIPGREKALENFLKQSYEGHQHKWQHRANSHSEDALTWSCFDVIANFPLGEKKQVIQELWEDAFENRLPLPGIFNNIDSDKLKIFVGANYQGTVTGEKTEVDASIEAPGLLIFFESKLYSTVSLPEPSKKSYDQIARKLRVGLDNPSREGEKLNVKDFYFIFLDIAPLEKLIKRQKKDLAFSKKGIGFHDKWKSALIFDYYRRGRNNSLKPLEKVLSGIPNINVKIISERMGWFTWADLFKIIMRRLV